MHSLTTFAEPPVHLYDALERAGRLYPDKSFTLLDNRGRVAERRSFSELHAAAVETAARYRTLGLEPGDTVLLSLPTSFDWLDAWFGAVLSRALPAAIAPPGALGSPVVQIQRTLEVCEQMSARFLVATGAIVKEAQNHIPAELETRLLDVSELRATAPAGAGGPDLDPDAEEIAFLQLTSGSTGHSRVVQISHRAAAHNALVSTEGISGPHGVKSSAMVCWLPLYHDLGLVGCVLNCLVNGIDVVLLNPRTFLARPWIWLEVVSRYGQNVVSPAPNFAYRLSAERTAGRDLSGLDLSGWRDAMCGSEMIRPETMALFSQSFAPHGFGPRSIRPCYGLAEGTLAVTFDTRLEGVRTRPMPVSTAQDDALAEVVSNGTPVRDTKVEIRSPSGQARTHGETGEVWVRGPGVFSGYLGDPAATAACWVDDWLDTGDLGFLDQDGELYLTGRSKEILILMGHNLMPHEIEWVAEGAIDAGGSQRTGAFAVDSAEGEQAVLAVEVTETDPERLAEIRHAVASAVGRALSLPLADVVLLKRGSIPRTSSGKVQRRELRQRYTRGELVSLPTGAER